MANVLTEQPDGSFISMPLPEGGTETPVDATGLQEQIDTHQHILQDHDGAIRECQTRLSTLEPRVDSLEKAIASAPSGGAILGRGYSYLTDFPGTTPADKLRNAWTVGRAIVPDPNATIDVGASPITIPAGAVLKGLAGPQNEFSLTWPLNVRHTGGSAVFKTAAAGSNHAGDKGWTFQHLGFEGTGTVNLFQANPMDASGLYPAYATIEGCSADNFNTVMDTPLLGCVIDWRYLNNLTRFGCRLGGSDNTLFPMGGKQDFGGPAAGDSKRAAVLILSSLQKSYVGPIYITGQPSTALLIEGGFMRDGVTILGATFEGRNGATGAAGAVVRVTGAGANFVSCSFNFGMRNPTATGRDDKGIVHVSGGRVMLRDCFHESGGGAAPFVAQTGGSAKVRDAVGVGGTTLTYSGAVSVS